MPNEIASYRRPNTQKAVKIARLKEMNRMVVMRGWRYLPTREGEMRVVVQWI